MGAPCGQKTREQQAESKKARRSAPFALPFFV
jgi:hypothetical protein